MIYEVKMFAGKCDNCGSEWEGDYSCFNDLETMRDELVESDWYEVDGENGEPDKHYCPNCYIIDDVDNFILKSKIQ